MKNNNEVVYLTFEQSQDLVDRIADKTERFNHTMTDNEKTAMADLLSNIGVKVSDLVDVSYLADNYAINAELVGPEEVENYSRSSLENALFSWEEDDGTHYCIQW